jgi:hypothetical protein
LVRKLLDSLEVERGSDRWNELEGYAEDVAGGWWDEPQYAFPGVRRRLHQTRQHVIESAKAYELVFEVQAVRRYPVPPAVMREQLHHLLDLGRRKNVSIRVARVEGQIGDGATPRGPFAHITYTDPGDPRIVAVDNVTGDMLVTDAAEVAGYAQLHERLCTTALSDADSAAIITEVAERLAAEI